jgi:hypothetical protein
MQAGESHKKRFAGLASLGQGLSVVGVPGYFWTEEQLPAAGKAATTN